MNDYDNQILLIEYMLNRLKLILRNYLYIDKKSKKTRNKMIMKINFDKILPSKINHNFVHFLMQHYINVLIHLETYAN